MPCRLSVREKGKRCGCDGSSGVATTCRPLAMPRNAAAALECDALPCPFELGRAHQSPWIAQAQADHRPAPNEARVDAGAFDLGLAIQHKLAVHGGQPMVRSHLEQAAVLFSNRRGAAQFAGGGEEAQRALDVLSFNLLPGSRARLFVVLLGVGSESTGPANTCLPKLLADISCMTACCLAARSTTMPRIIDKGKSRIAKVIATSAALISRAFCMVMISSRT